MKNDVRKTINVGGGFGINMADIESFNVENNIQQLEYQGDSESNLLSQRLTLANPIILEQDQKLEIEEDLKQNYIQKVPTWISFLILAYFALNGSFVPPWILTIPAEKYLRVAWRFFMQGMLLLPFVMWEYRQKKGSNIYTFSYIFTMERIKKAYLSSFANSLWFTIACFGFGLGSFISSIYVAKVFEPLDIQTAQSFEPTMATMLAYLMNVQHLPGGLGCIAQAFIVPGNFFINLGQYMYTQNQVLKNEQMYNKQNYFKQSVFTRIDKYNDAQKEK
ncbi:hypothetical protein PPERSA_09515 [Pseudocohnilembus persalinus]|uniref:Uncharacterized protein n=1 Tax=Pseudocohnilembus persalinus TaxID=266149 RepID=A0A0V0QFD4_PSEPJ|nr:hypothetical protein PPERSA_09515 [Pseudocohnilembus persalinus]|eukprot:KRX00909.1 hypothetical protein PPERSA_09515 [Pseudocohnilembus persalinus]